MMGLISLKRSEKIECGKVCTVVVMHLRRGRLSRTTESIQRPLAGLKDACTNGIIPARGGASNNCVAGSSSEPEDEERKERAGSEQQHLL
ncbi:hypothetical protein VPH35_099194 [Triticum aestivum]